MKNEVAYTTLTRRDESGETKVALNMTEAEFWRLVNERSMNKAEKRKLEPYKHRLELAQVATLPGEELKEENFNGVNTEGFEKAIVLLKCWAEMIQRVMFQKKSFRIEIKYNAETMKTDFAIYTPTEHGSSDMPPEY